MKKVISLILSVVMMFSVGSLFASAYEESLPSSYSSLDYDYVTGVKNQGMYGTCWAHAVISCLESDAIIQGYGNKDNIDFSEAFLIWDTYIYGEDREDGLIADAIPVGCYGENTAALNEGGNAESVISLSLAGSGVQDEDKYPYTYIMEATCDNDGNIIDICYEDTHGKSVSEMMCNYDDSCHFTNNGLTVGTCKNLYSTQDMKEWIVEHGAITASYYDSGHSNKVSSNNYAYFDNSSGTNHMVSIVGWDDNYPKENFKNTPSKDGAWLVKNSWGTSSRAGGYFWMSYDQKTCEHYGFTVCNASDNTYTHTYADCFYTRDCSKGEGAANVFKATDNEYIEKLYIKTDSCDRSSCSADVYIYELNDNYSSPVDGTRIYSAQVDIGTKNYTQIYVPDIPITAGKSYSIIFMFLTDVNLYTESMYSASTSCKTRTFVGDTYYYFSYPDAARAGDVTEWRDATLRKNSICGNACISMFTNDEPANKDIETLNAKNEVTLSALGEDAINPEDVIIVSANPTVIEENTITYGDITADDTTDDITDDITDNTDSSPLLTHFRLIIDFLRTVFGFIFVI